MKLRKKTLIPSDLFPSDGASTNLTATSPGIEKMMPSTSRNVHPIYAYSTRRSSTASADQPLSPDSPGIGRIAKSNARLLNGLDLSTSKNSRSYLDSVIALPELKAFELIEKCPTVNKFVKEAENKLNMEQLPAVQFELEELISQNVDYQKTIQGEISYLTTGEYPIIDLKDRSMPIYEKLKSGEFKKLSERAKQSEVSPNTHLADLGILSSPEEDETPHILDVPHRFWTWTKEYLSHIGVDYLKQFKERMIDRYSEENIAKYLDEGMDNIRTPKFTSTHTKSKIIKRKFCSSDDFPPQRTPIKQLKLQKFSKDFHESSKQPASEPSHHLASCQSNGKTGGKKLSSVTPRMNGVIHRRLSNGIKRGSKRILACSSKTKTTAKVKSQKMRTSSKFLNKVPKEESTDEESSSEEECDVFEGNGVIDEQMDEQKPGTSKQQKNEDEVVQELRKKQAQMRELLLKAKPKIKELYMRALKEYAVYEAFRQMDETDNKLYQLGSKFETLNFFNKEQKQEAHDAVQDYHQANAIFYPKAPESEQR